MKTDLEVEVEVDLRPLGKVIILRDRQTHRTFLLYIDIEVEATMNLNMAEYTNSWQSVAGAAEECQ